jgi:hypothetical protein
MEKIVEILVGIIENAEKRHFILIKNFLRLLLIVGVASLFYEKFIGTYHIIDFSVKSLVEFFDKGTFWICFLNFLLSACLYLNLHYFTSYIFYNKSKKSGDQFRLSSQPYRHSFSQKRELFGLVETLFFTESSNAKNRISGLVMRLIIKFFKYLKVVTFDSSGNGYQIDRLKIELLRSFKKDISQINLRSLNDFFADIIICLMFLSAILIYKTHLNVGILCVAITTITYFIISLLAKVVGIFTYFISDIDVYLSILQRVTRKKNMGFSQFRS